MFYRQKILLALIELCGGKIKSTDLEKLLFLYCKTTEENHYDFFPYKFGAFSFVSYYDKRKLIEKGVLKNADDFELVSSKSYVRQLSIKDQHCLREFVTKTQNLRGKQLLRKTYIEHPFFAYKSEIAHSILTIDELQRMNSNGAEITTSDSTLFTIGYEGISIDEYLYQLIKKNVKALIDVRQNPLSRKHGFSKNALASYLQKVNIAYYHIPELGIPSNLRKDLNGDKSYSALFDHYAENILPYQSIYLEKIQDLLKKHKRLTLTCFEADHNYCHRHKITEALKADNSFNYPVVHI